ncbi:unnamed protein product [Alopecurus aequalis]
MNKWRRTLERTPRCTICGQTEEDAFHASVSCSKASALRHAMREYWDLPAESCFVYTGEDWLQNLLCRAESSSRANILLLLWRAWHLRNDCIHQNGKETIRHSVQFLRAFNSEDSSLSQADAKGKKPMFPAPNGEARHHQHLNQWTPPPPGWSKLNTDGSFNSQTRRGGMGVVARDCKGKMMMASCAPIQPCHSAEEAEARAALYGLQQMSNSGSPKIILEMDCYAATLALASTDQDLSPLWDTYEEAKRLISGFEAVSIRHSKRESNAVADALVKFARSSCYSPLQNPLPPMLEDLVIRDSLQTTNTGM